jgi:hypothetical protein
VVKIAPCYDSNFKVRMPNILRLNNFVPYSLPVVPYVYLYRVCYVIIFGPVSCSGKLLESTVKKLIIHCPFSLLQCYLSVVLKLNNASSWKALRYLLSTWNAVVMPSCPIQKNSYLSLK